MTEIWDPTHACVGSPIFGRKRCSRGRFVVVFVRARIPCKIARQPSSARASLTFHEPDTHLESPLSRWVSRLNYMFKTGSVQTRRTLLREPLPHGRQVSEVWTGDSHPASDDPRGGLPGGPAEAGSSKAPFPHTAQTSKGLQEGSTTCRTYYA